MLRVSDTDPSRDPEGHLFTAASNLVKKYAVLDRRQEASVDVDDPSVQVPLGELPGFDNSLYTAFMFGPRTVGLHATWRS